MDNYYYYFKCFTIIVTHRHATGSDNSVHLERTGGVRKTRTELNRSSPRPQWRDGAIGIVRQPQKSTRVDGIGKKNSNEKLPIY